MVKIWLASTLGLGAGLILGAIMTDRMIYKSVTAFSYYCGYNIGLRVAAETLGKPITPLDSPLCHKLKEIVDLL